MEKVRAQKVDAKIENVANDIYGQDLNKVGLKMCSFVTKRSVLFI